MYFLFFFPPVSTVSRRLTWCTCNWVRNKSCTCWLLTSWFHFTKIRPVDPFCAWLLPPFVQRHAPRTRCSGDSQIALTSEGEWIATVVIGWQLSRITPSQPESAVIASDLPILHKWIRKNMDDEKALRNPLLPLWILGLSYCISSFIGR